MTKNKDILSLLQSRIALRANFLAEYAPNRGTDWPAVGDQKADKKAVAEIVKLRRELKYLSAVVETNNMEIKVLQLEVKLLSDKEKENRWFLVKDGY